MMDVITGRAPPSHEPTCNNPGMSVYSRYGYRGMLERDFWRDMLPRAPQRPGIVVVIPEPDQDPRAIESTPFFSFRPRRNPLFT